jgi:hypothetical protein
MLIAAPGAVRLSSSGNHQCILYALSSCDMANPFSSSQQSCVHSFWCAVGLGETLQESPAASGCNVVDPASNVCPCGGVCRWACV